VLGQEQEPVFRDRLVERRALRFPVGKELRERARIDDGAREDMRAHLGSLLDDAHGKVLRLSTPSCFRRIAAARPAGPAPTTTT
jgi:hypothetical protein